MESLSHLEPFAPCQSPLVHSASSSLHRSRLQDHLRCAQKPREEMKWLALNPRSVEDPALEMAMLLIDKLNACDPVSGFFTVRNFF